MRAPEDESLGMRARQLLSESLNALSDFGTELVPVAAAPDVLLAGLVSEDFMPVPSVEQAAKPPARKAQNNPNNADRAFIDESSSMKIETTAIVGELPAL
jgi:hypothetical protein